MDRKVRLGFVGVGNMGQAAHLRNYATLSDCEVVAIAELRPRLAQAVAQRYGVPRVYQQAEDMLAHEQLDGLVASQPFERHGQVIPPLYAAGIPVFTEKPLAAPGGAAAPRGRARGPAAPGQWPAYPTPGPPATMSARQEIARLQQ